MNWTYLAHDMDKWWAVVNTILNLQLPYHVENVSTARGTLSSSRTTAQRNEWASESAQYMNVLITSLVYSKSFFSLTGIHNGVSPMCWGCFPHVPPIWITSSYTCIGNAAQFQGWLYCSMDQGSPLQFANGTRHSLQWSGHCGWWTWISACRVDTLPLPARPIHKISDTSVDNFVSTIQCRMTC